MARGAFAPEYRFASHWLDLGGVGYHYLDEGPRAAPPVVMLHGNPTWSFYYRTLIPALSTTHRVIVPDHVGCGLSDKPAGYSYRLDQHITNLERLVEALRLQRLTLVMHDWGGPIGMGYATRHPDNVARLAVLNTAAFLLPRLPLSITMCRWPVWGPLVVRGANAFARLALLLAVVHRERITAAVRAGYLAPYDSWATRLAVHRFVQDIPLEPDHPSRATAERIESGLSRLRDHPMLIIWGARDFCFTVQDALAGWRTRFPEARVRLVEDAGHYVVEDAHERIGPWLAEFLARTS